MDWIQLMKSVVVLLCIVTGAIQIFRSAWTDRFQQREDMWRELWRVRWDWVTNVCTGQEQLCSMPISKSTLVKDTGALFRSHIKSVHLTA